MLSKFSSILIEDYKIKKTSDSFYASFDIPGTSKRMLATFDDNGQNEWLFEFGITTDNESIDDYSMQNWSSISTSLAVMKTIKDIVNKFISTMKPKEIMYSADKDEPSRERAYNKLFKEFRINSIDSGHDIIYHVKLS